MMDSCRPRKVEPGLAATNSKPRDLITSTMKSPPGRSVVKICTSGVGSASRGTATGALAATAAACGAANAPREPASVAIPPSAAPFRNLRRSTKSFLDLLMAQRPSHGLSARECAGAPYEVPYGDLYTSHFGSLQANCVLLNSPRLKLEAKASLQLP